MPRRYECPFFRKDEKYILCEAGKVDLPEKVDMDNFALTYCAGEWRRCSIARALLMHYERKESEEKKHG